MKKAQKLFSVVLALMLAFAMTIPAFAADDGSIVISGSANVAVAGKTFNAYKILDAKFVDEADTSKGVAYSVPDALKSFYETEFELDATKANFNAEVVAAISKLSADELNAFADKALAAAKTANIAAKSATAGVGATTVTISGLALGYYVIEDATANANGANTAISSVMLDTTDKAAQVKIKADLPSIEKKIDGYNDTDESTTGLVEYNNAAIGDKVPFVLTSKVPKDMEYYDTYTYTVTDTLSDGLSFNNDVVIKIGEKTLEVKEDYTVDVDGQIVTINFKNFKSYAAGTDITIEYSATVDTDAVIGTQGNLNTVYLEYSNNPQDSASKGKTPDETTLTFVTAVSITKVDEKDNDKTLAGATFTIAGTKLNTVIVTDANGKDIVIQKAEDVEYTGTSGADGVITFEGLAAGTYTITEIVAPEGYNLLAEPIKFTVSWVAPAEGSTECTWSVEAEGDIASIENGIVVVTIENSTGSLLPETGGIGTTIFYIVGGLLVVGAVVLLITKKRMSVETSK